MRKGLPLVAAGACLVFASLALAGPAVTDTTVVMQDRGTSVEYSGQVSADPPKTLCVSGRKIQVYHQNKLIAETTTKQNGSWKVEGPRPPDGDRVTVVVKNLKRKGKTKCKAAYVDAVFLPAAA